MSVIAAVGLPSGGVSQGPTYADSCEDILEFVDEGNERRIVDVYAAHVSLRFPKCVKCTQERAYAVELAAMAMLFF